MTIKLPGDINLPQSVVIVLVWSMILLGVGAYLGASLVDVDCETCESSLEDAIKQLHACEQKLLTPDTDRCEDERLTERKLCEGKLAEYKRLRCKICELTHDSYPPEPNDPSDASSAPRD
jgi:hypothetical protein